MRDIIDEYMEEIKHAYMANQPHLDTTNLASKPSSMNDVHEDNESRNSKKSVPQMRSSRYGDEIKEKSNKNRHQESYTSNSRYHDHRQQDDYKQSRKYKRSNEFEDRYDPSKSHDSDEDGG